MMMNETYHYENAFIDGKKERNYEIAKNLLNQKININVIAQATGLTNKQISALATRKVS